MANTNIKKNMKLDGLSCTACETRIEQALLKLKGVKEVKVSYKTSMLVITFDNKIVGLNQIVKEIESLDYKVVDEFIQKTGKANGREKEIEEKEKEYKQFIAIAIGIVAIYLIISKTIGFDYIPQVNEKFGYGLLFLVGLLTSLHCIAMCGGINLSVCVSYQNNRKNTTGFYKYVSGIFYNAGRVVSYTLIGGIVGALGSVFSISNTGSVIVSVIAGVFMIIMGMNLLNLFPALRKLNPHMPKLFARQIYREKATKGPFIVGLLNGLMPCGPLQAMQLYALGTGSFITGAFSMFLFSLGTVPLLFAFGAVGSALSSKFTKKMLKVSGVLVVVLGFIMINRGIAFAGITMDSVFENFTGNSGYSVSSSDTNSEKTNGSDEKIKTGTEATTGNAGAATGNTETKTGNTEATTGNIQEIKTTLQSGSYPKLTVQNGIPVTWTITADAKNLTGCNNQIIIPQYGIKQKLVVGDNVITFTPTKTGSFGYSCWMGMIRSSITVE